MMMLLSIGILPALATQVTFTFTGDNLVSAAWFTDGGSPTSLGLDPSSDPMLKNWREADTYTLDLLPGHHYQIIWQVVNDDNDGGFRPPGPTNPGGFLAEIEENPSITFTEGSWLSSSLWEVALIQNSLIPPSDFNSLSWAAATEWGTNNDPSTIWYHAKGGPVSNISGDSHWIWTAANFAMPDAPGFKDSVFVKVEFDTHADPVPEPGTVLLLGSGLLSLWRFRKKFQK